jgi:phospholipid transport system substrate-binding protein
MPVAQQTMPAADTAISWAGWLGRAARAPLAALVLLQFTAPALAVDEPSSDASRLISKTVDEVLVVLKDPGLDGLGRRQRIEAIAYDLFDFVTVSRLVVAKYWKQFDPEQQQELVENFKAFLAQSYGERIDRYNQETVELVGERPEQRGDVTVFTRIVGGQYDGAEVEYRMREIDGRWRAIDVKVEGISLVLNYRDQFKSILSRKGPKGLLEALRKKKTEGASVDES